MPKVTELSTPLTNSPSQDIDEVKRIPPPRFQQPQSPPKQTPRDDPRAFDYSITLPQMQEKEARYIQSINHKKHLKEQERENIGGEEKTDAGECTVGVSAAAGIAKGKDKDESEEENVNPANSIPLVKHPEGAESVGDDSQDHNGAKDATPENENAGRIFSPRVDDDQETVSEFPLAYFHTAIQKQKTKVVAPVEEDPMKLLTPTKELVDSKTITKATSTAKSKSDKKPRRKRGHNKNKSKHFTYRGAGNFDKRNRTDKKGKEPEKRRKKRSNGPPTPKKISLAGDNDEALRWAPSAAEVFFSIRNSNLI